MTPYPEQRFDPPAFDQSAFDQPAYSLAQLTSPQDPPRHRYSQRRSGPGSHRRLGLIILAVCALLVLAAIGAAVYAYTRPDPVMVDPNAALIAACQDGVRKQLKAPASAAFSEDRKVGDGGRVSYVHGVVDAQNGFGAVVRNRYECVAEGGGAAWTVTNVRLYDWP